MILTRLRVGPAGAPAVSSTRFIEWIDLCQTRGFTALELEFVSITATEYPDSEAMENLAKYAEKHEVKLSIHGSFYINLAAIEESKIKISKEYLIEGIRVAEAASANLIFHPGYFQTLSHREALQKSINFLNNLEMEIPSILYLETPGKLNAIGDLSEMLEIAASTGVRIAIDFAHYYGRTQGNLRDKADIIKILTRIENEIDQQYFHMHISGIEYTKKGEKRHRPFQNSDFPVELVIEALQEVDYSGTLICESPNRWNGDTEILLRLIRGEHIQISRKPQKTLRDYFK